jgi:hypothetical protein
MNSIQGHPYKQSEGHPYLDPWKEAGLTPLLVFKEF